VDICALGLIHLLGYTTCVCEEDIISTYFLAGAAKHDEKR